MYHILCALATTDEGNDGHALVLLGISGQAWAKWAEVAAEHQLVLEALFGQLIEAAHTGTLTLTPSVTEEG